MNEKSNDEAMTIIEPIVRNPDGLRQALFSEIESLKSGASTITRARAVGKLAEEIHKSIRLEIEAQRALEDTIAAQCVTLVQAMKDDEK